MYIFKHAIHVSQQSYTLPAFFGGVELTDLNTIVSVRAVSLAYFLDVSEPWMEEIGDEWERILLHDIQELAKIYAPDLEVLQVRMTSEITKLFMFLILLENSANESVFAW